MKKFLIIIFLSLLIGAVGAKLVAPQLYPVANNATYFNEWIIGQNGIGLFNKTNPPDSIDLDENYLSIRDYTGFSNRILTAKNFYVQDTDTTKFQYVPSVSYYWSKRRNMWPDSSILVWDAANENFIPFTGDSLTIVIALADSISLLNSEVDSLTGRVTTAEANITTNSSNVTDNSGAITTLQSLVALKANTTSVDSLNDRMTSAEGSISTNASNISVINGTVSALQASVALKANTSFVDSINARLTTAEGSIITNASNISINNGEITSLQASVALKANTTYVDSVEGRVTSAEGSISTNALNITSNDGDISNLQASVALKANVTTVDSLNGRVTTAESGITANASDINGVLNSNLYLYAQADSIISYINLNPNSLKLSGSTITLDGNTTVEGSFSVSGNVLSGGTITGVAYNNGSGTFQVDASGNLTATSAIISGTVNASAGTFSGNITSTATITGGTVRTASTGERIELDGTTNTIKIYNSSGDLSSTIYGGEDFGGNDYTYINTYALITNGQITALGNITSQSGSIYGASYYIGGSNEFASMSSLDVVIDADVYKVGGISGLNGTYTVGHNNRLNGSTLQEQAIQVTYTFGIPTGYSTGSWTNVPTI